MAWQALARLTRLGVYCAPPSATRIYYRSYEMPEVIVYLAAGRSLEQKKALMKDISEAVAKNANVTIDAVTVQIVEAPAADKMVGGVLLAERPKK
jgi:4-oxalocrotonate tautomerase